MTPYGTYRLHEIERAKSPAEIQRADEQAAQFASALSRLFGGIVRRNATSTRQRSRRHEQRPGAAGLAWLAGGVEEMARFGVGGDPVEREVGVSGVAGRCGVALPVDGVVVSARRRR
jgi:hypothetical protein